MIVLGTAGTAGLIRVMRGMLLDELRKQYVITARAKGVSELTVSRACKPQHWFQSGLSSDLKYPL